MLKFTPKGSIGLLFVKTFILLFLISLAGIYFVFIHIAYPQLLHVRQTVLLKSGEAIVERIEHEMKDAQVLSQTIALTYQFEWSDDVWLTSHLPSLFTLNSDNSFVAGGGVWPETYSFVNKLGRKPLFWGHDKKGEFRFFDDYGKESDVNYRHAEWYLPVKLASANLFYWSKVYRDPFSHQAMVTCSTPIVAADDTFNGVATVDLSLQGVHAVFERLLNDSDGYMFAVDSFGTVFANTFKENTSRDFLHIDELIEKHNFLMPIKTLVDNIHQINRQQEGTSDLIVPLVHSPEIDKKSAGVIAGRLIAFPITQELPSSLLKTFIFSYDDLLKESSSVMVFYMPSTGWIVVVAQTRESHPPLWWIPARVALLFTLIILSIFIIGYFILRKVVTRPLNDVSEQLQSVGESDLSNFIALKCQMNNEVGELVYHLNRRGVKLNHLHETLVRSQKSEAIGTLAGKLSHDFGNILNGIKGTVSVLTTRLSTSPTIFSNELAGHLESLTLLVDQGSSILKDLMLLSQDKKHVYSPLMLDMSDMARMVLKHFMLRVDSSVHVHSELSKNCRVFADPTFLETTILNFCINAEHAMTIMQPDANQQGGELLLSVFIVQGSDVFAHHDAAMQEKRYVALSVKDDGVGIKQEILARIFDPFFTSKARGKGNGLGLALVQRGVRAHKGEVTVVTTVGKGSTFTIYLPLS